MKESDFKIKIAKFEKAISFQILYQSERFTTTLTELQSSKSILPEFSVGEVGYAIRTSAIPAFQLRGKWEQKPNYIFLRGRNETKNDRVITITFKNNGERDQFIDGLKKVIKKVADLAAGRKSNFPLHDYPFSLL